jgi:uncharacterized repeat protein (TIGR03803 family)
MRLGTCTEPRTRGATDNFGTIFKLDPSGVVTILHSLGFDEGSSPEGGLLRDTEGNLFGTTTAAGGTVFKLDASNTFKTLHSFGNGTDGAGPLSRLVTSNGDLYGITRGGGGSSDCTGGCGTIFKMTKGGTETILYRFEGGADGAYPAGLTRDAAGNLYGVATSNVSAPGAGTVWRLDVSGAFTVLYTFTGGPDGGNPADRLARDSANGTLRGVTFSGGDSACNCGVVFDLDASGNETVVHKFFGNGGGALPSVGTLDIVGTLYGTTLSGGDFDCNPSQKGCGVIYQIGKTGKYSPIHRFAGANSGDGDNSAFGGLTLGTDGSIYGATYYGGTGSCTNGSNPGCGVVFKYTP